YLMATFALPVFDITEPLDPFGSVVECIREAIFGLCGDETVLRSGVLWAERFIRRYKDLAEGPQERLVQQALNIKPDLATQFDRISQELVAPARAAAEAERIDQRFKRLSQRYGVSIRGSIVSVEDRDGSFPLRDAHADLAPTTVKGSAITEASPSGMNITIKARDFEAALRPVPLARTEDAKWWVEQFNRAAQAAKESGP
ncbi:MAG TPA: hypothetical protein VMC83_19510, partial [Streptosporangiaceae bacterium]|nr:hypothetical protein [Streptosporangiaceae bacterium]